MVQNKGVAANTMAFKSGLSRERGRRRRKFAWRSTLWLAAVAGFAAIGYSSYQAGIVLAHQEVSGLENNLASLTGKLAAVKSENDRLRTDLGQTRQATDILKKRYDADVPAGALARLVDLLRLRLAGGLPDERIAKLLREAGPVRACDGRIVRKRFAIQTAGQGAEEPVSLLDGLVLVSASAPAGPEDPSKTAPAGAAIDHGQQSGNEAVGRVQRRAWLWFCIAVGVRQGLSQRSSLAEFVCGVACNRDGRDGNGIPSTGMPVTRWYWQGHDRCRQMQRSCFNYLF